jgi:hypothetical protein
MLWFVFLPLTTVAAFGQAGYGGQEDNLRGLKGVRLVVMFGRAGSIEEAERPGILKLVEADATAKLQKAGISLVENAGSPRLVVSLTCDKPNGFVYPVVATVTLLQRARLARDPSIEGDLATWEDGGVGDLKTLEVIRGLVADEMNHFIMDYQAVNLTTARR